MNEKYIIYDLHYREYYESYLDEDGGHVFTNGDIDLAYQFDSYDEAKRFCENHFREAVVLKWM